MGMENGFRSLERRVAAPSIELIRSSRRRRRGGQPANHSFSTRACDARRSVVTAIAAVEQPRSDRANSR